MKKRESEEKKKLHGIWLMRGLLSRGYNLMVDLLIYKPFNPFTLPTPPTPQLYVEIPISVKLCFDATVRQVWQRCLQ